MLTIYPSGSLLIGAIPAFRTTSSPQPNIYKWYSSSNEELPVLKKSSYFGSNKTSFLCHVSLNKKNKLIKQVKYINRAVENNGSIKLKVGNSDSIYKRLDDAVISEQESNFLQNTSVKSSANGFEKGLNDNEEPFLSNCIEVGFDKNYELFASNLRLSNLLQRDYFYKKATRAFNLVPSQFFTHKNKYIYQKNYKPYTAKLSFKHSKKYFSQINLTEYFQLKLHIESEVCSLLLNSLLDHFDVIRGVNLCDNNMSKSLNLFHPPRYQFKTPCDSPERLLFSSQEKIRKDHQSVGNLCDNECSRNPIDSMVINFKQKTATELSNSDCFVPCGKLPVVKLLNDEFRSKLSQYTHYDVDDTLPSQHLKKDANLQLSQEANCVSSIKTEDSTKYSNTCNELVEVKYVQLSMSIVLALVLHAMQSLSQVMLDIFLINDTPQSPW